MLQKRYTHLNTAPAVLLFKNTIEESAAKGTVLFYHGLGANKEGQNKELEGLAHSGFLAVGVDNIGHGERRYSDFEHIFSKDNPNLENAFVNAVLQTIEEIPRVVDALIENNWLKNGKIGICGISMGGYIAYGAPTVDKRIKVITPILGSPEWAVEHKSSPHHYPQQFFPIALLAQNAGADKSVPPHFARNFNECLQSFYRQSPEKLQYIEYPNAEHFMPEEDWNILWNRTLEWLHRYV